MAQPRLGTPQHSTELDDWEPPPPPAVDLGDDLRAAVTRAAANEERLIVREGDEELAAIIPMDDFRLLLRLEEEELDRIDIEEVRRRRADPEDQEWIPLAQVKAEMGLSSAMPCTATCDPPPSETWRASPLLEDHPPRAFGFANTGAGVARTESCSLPSAPPID